MLRIGQGYDIHRLVRGKALKLGGVAVDSDLGPESHSDGDILLHAVANALLGAIGAGDLGFHFPDSDERFRGIDSAKLVNDVSVICARVRSTAGPTGMILVTVLPPTACVSDQLGPCPCEPASAQ